MTVLFADIVGSTALVDRLDPEDVRALQHAYFDTVAGVLGRWHGVVEKYIGDAVMALFGARESDGFDAYRAVRAGLEIQRSLDRRSLVGGPALRVRVGVATGEAVVDLAATRDGGHGTASGAVITLAARLQEYAPPGGVARCAATHRATDGMIDQRPVPPVAVAGKPLPLDVWHATDVARPAPGRHAGPLIGRRRELATVRDQLVRTVRERRPRWVSLVGPAGSGRSRLLHELVRTVQAVDGIPVRWCVAHCPPYPAEALAPVADQVRAFAGLRARDTPPVVRRQLAAAVTDLVPAPRRTEAVYALEGLLAGPDAGTDAQRGAAVWQECLLALAERQPMVVAVDDLDRGAPELGHFLHRLLAAARTRAVPLAVVALHGPDRADDRPGDRGCRVPLGRLSSVESGRLLRHLLHRAGQPAPLVAALLPLVDGHPGRAAAYVAALPPGGADPARLPVPDPVRRTVDTRLDRLDGPQRAVLMAAAAAGTPVDAAAVDHLFGWVPGRAVAALRELVDRDLLTLRPAGYAVSDPVVAAVAAARLTRAARTALLARTDQRQAPSALPTRSAAPTAEPAEGRSHRVPADGRPGPIAAHRTGALPAGAAVPLTPGGPDHTPGRPSHTGDAADDGSPRRATRPASPDGRTPAAPRDGSPRTTTIARSAALVTTRSASAGPAPAVTSTPAVAGDRPPRKAGSSAFPATPEPGVPSPRPGGPERDRTSGDEVARSSAPPRVAAPRPVGAPRRLPGERHEAATVALHRRGRTSATPAVRAA
ncbi:AAA family ATPase [Micromonospora thermarum]|uniref:AAA family ATPase n=1 Tax=Micromonospora thermarum TaxID=2720024 RepID=UPI002815DF44|nr:adenylate/guanylate cyclase domain-containing protein [Micromonospora thermarum]